MVNVYDVNPLVGEYAINLEWTAPLALSSYSKLVWLQFSTSGNLVTMDDGEILGLKIIIFLFKQNALFDFTSTRKAFGFQFCRALTFSRIQNPISFGQLY